MPTGSTISRGRGGRYLGSGPPHNGLPRASNAVRHALLPATRGRIRAVAAYLVNQKGYGRYDAVKTACERLADELGYADRTEEMLSRAILDWLV